MPSRRMREKRAQVAWVHKREYSGDAHGQHGQHRSAHAPVRRQGPHLAAQRNALPHGLGQGVQNLAQPSACAAVQLRRGGEQAHLRQWQPSRQVVQGVIPAAAQAHFRGSLTQFCRQRFGRLA